MAVWPVEIPRVRFDIPIRFLLATIVLINESFKKKRNTDAAYGFVMRKTAYELNRVPGRGQ